METPAKVHEIKNVQIIKCGKKGYSAMTGEVLLQRYKIG